MIPNVEGFKIMSLRTVDDVINNWAFFTEGLKKLNCITRPDKQVEPDTFLRVVMDTATGPEASGFVWIITSKNNKPLCFTVFFDSSTKYHKGRSLLGYAVYSTEKSRTVVKWTVLAAKDWAKKHGYDEIHAFSPRFNGAGFYWFERVLGFRRCLVFFTQSV